MQTEYRYGAYGELGESVVQTAAQSGTVPVYIGTAPVNLVRGWAERDLVNFPLLVSSMTVARQSCGDVADWKRWKDFTLCEAFAAHYDNPKGNIGPIIAINVLDPAKHRKAAPVERELTFSGGRCEFLSDTIILDSFLIAERMEGTDFSLAYDFDKGKVILTALGDTPIDGAVDATWNEVDPAAVAVDDVIGGEPEDGLYTGIKAAELIYTALNSRVVNLMAAPGWSDKPAVYRALLQECKSINGHWGAFCPVDVPLQDGAEKIDTREKANKWAKTNGYTSDWSKPYWPQGMDAEGRVFHLSTLAVVEYMRIDADNGNVPMETNGNKSIPIVRQYFGEDSASRGFDQQKGNYLTCRGISTAIYWAGEWVLWGNCTGAYLFPDPDDPEINSIELGDPRGNFDTNMRMLLYLINGFQQRWGTTIDRPMTLQLKERILNQEQELLDALVAQGALIGNPVIQFLEADNSTTDMQQGNFVWRLAATPTPPLKSASIKVHHTVEGYAVYTTEEVAA